MSLLKSYTTGSFSKIPQYYDTMLNTKEPDSASHMFNLKGKIFQFEMSDCNKMIRGKCPIETGDESVDCKCNQLKKELIESKFVMNGNLPVVVYHTECGHYSCNDGQHRICVAGKMHREIEVNYEGNAPIERCALCENIPNYTECSCFLEEIN